jgi:hypothetical protein
MNQYLFASLTRIAPLKTHPFRVNPLPRKEWRSGDYIVAEVLTPCCESAQVELPNGRLISPLPGDMVVGALGRRHATLEIVGDWRKIDDDLEFDLLTSAGLLGKVTSRAYNVPEPAKLRYRGHLWFGATHARMADYAVRAAPRPYEIPTVLIIGTSMSAGKTTAGRMVVHALKEKGLTVAAAKLTGAGRYRDILSFGDAGADHIYDFVDAGLPSTVCGADTYRKAVIPLLSQMASDQADVAVIEAGASPLEPYNGAVAMQLVGNESRYTILSASDPYAVLGVMRAFDIRPDLVTGIAANTTASIELVRELTGIAAVDVMGSEGRRTLGELVGAKFLDVLKR